MLQGVALLRNDGSEDDLELGDIHCPSLLTLFLIYDLHDVIKSLTVGPLNNVHHLCINQDHDEDEDGKEILRFLRLLEALPNLVSLSWTFPLPRGMTRAFPRRY